jgi:hypothetical protein
MGTCSSNRSCSSPRRAAEPPYRERFLPPALSSNGAEGASRSAPPTSDRSDSGAGLERRDEHEGAPAGDEMTRKRRNEPGGDATSVRPAVQREVDPRVGVPIELRRGQVRRIRQDQIESAKARRQVGPHRVNGKALVPRAAEQGSERRGIEVRCDDASRPTSCRDEGREPPAAAHFEHNFSSKWPRESSEQTGVLPHRIHLGCGARARSGPARRSAHRRVPNTL